MKELSEFITVHPYFAVFLTLVTLCAVGLLAEGIKGRAPKCRCRSEAKRREEQQ